MSNSETVKQLMRLKGVTDITGLLHELQIKNIQMYGFISFSTVNHKKIESRFDWEKRTVYYDVGVKLTATATKMKKLKEEWDRLNTWIQNLLGDEYRVVIAFKEDIKYRGKRKAPVPDSPEEN